VTVQETRVKLQTPH